MRHKKSFNHLGRTASHRRAMLANMATSLIMHKRITTTLAKAKALRSYVEPLITKSKNDTTHSRRVVFSYLQDKEAITELFREISVKVADRPGGYTRIIKLGTRQGDNAEMAMIELVDYNEHLLAEKAAKKSKSTRRRRGGKKKTAATVNTQAEQTNDAAGNVDNEAPVEEKSNDNAAAGDDTAKKDSKTGKENAPKAEDTHQEVSDGKEKSEENTDNKEEKDSK